VEARLAGRDVAQLAARLDAMDERLDEMEAVLADVASAEAIIARATGARATGARPPLHVLPGGEPA
jgi:hypothetical protein